MADRNTLPASSDAGANDVQDTFASGSYPASAPERPGHADARPKAFYHELGLLDRLLTPLILLCMIAGVLIGEYVPGVQPAFDTVQLRDVSIPIAIGLLVMMWPILTKVQYEALPRLLSSRALVKHALISLVLNWVVGPFVMLACAWAALPDLPTYRVGVILVGLARCIAMVMVWNALARGHAEYCAALVVLNSALQIVLYAPYALLFVNILGGSGAQISVSYGDVALSVLIYLGIPLVAGICTRYAVWGLTSRAFLEKRFLPVFGPLALIGLLYTIIVMFAYQGHHIVQNIGDVFRVIVPLVLYFCIMWSGAFALIWWLNRRTGAGGGFGYDLAVVHAFTAGSNNFELAIAVAVAVFGVGSDQALAATIGPLAEVPVLLALTWAALWLRVRLPWAAPAGVEAEKAGAADGRAEKAHIAEP